MYLSGSESSSGRVLDAMLSDAYQLEPTFFRNFGFSSSMMLFIFDGPTSFSSLLERMIGKVFSLYSPLSTRRIWFRDSEYPLFFFHS
jgi:hypothetical protein